jgi:hypothetical protein
MRACQVQATTPREGHSMTTDLEYLPYTLGFVAVAGIFWEVIR